MDGRPDPSRSAFAILLQDRENTLVRTLVDIAAQIGGGEPSAVIFDEVWFPPHGEVLDHQRLAEAFFDASGVQLKCEIASKSVAIVGAFLRRVRVTLEGGGFSEVGIDTIPVEGEHMCLPFAVLQLFPSLASIQEFVEQNPRGPFTYAYFTEQCPDVHFSLACANWSKTPGLYVVHERRLLRPDDGHASALRIQDDRLAVLSDEAFENAVVMSLEQLSSILSGLQNLLVFKVEIHERVDGEPRRKRRSVKSSDDWLAMSAGTSAMYPVTTACVASNCGGHLQKKGMECTAYTWNGGAWEEVEHGRKRCRKCGCSHRLSFAYVKGSKVITMTKAMFEDRRADHPLLVENYLGFRLSYLRQFLIRQFRCATSLLGEASTILQTHPDHARMNEDNLAKWLGLAVQIYLCFEDGRFKGMTVSRPIKADDPIYGKTNTGFYNFFIASEHDPDFDRRVKVRDVVADGNKVLTRRLQSEETALRKNPTGRPATSKKKPSGAMKKKLRKSRCAAVSQQERKEAASDPKKKRTEGVYATVDMRSGEILQFAEMLNPECRAYKNIAVTLTANQCKIGTHCLDCACTTADWEGVYCKRCLLDAWHALKHKCSRKRFDPKHKANRRHVKGRNTSAAEQLWSRTDKLAPFAMHFGRGVFRLVVPLAWNGSYMPVRTRSGTRSYRYRTKPKSTVTFNVLG